jgi:DNA polymerase-3 subunit alpha
VLGFYVTKHPLSNHEQLLRSFATADCSTIADLDDGVDIVIGGMISRMRTTVTKNGRNAGSKLAILVVEDLTGSIEAVVYGEELEKYRDLIGPDRLVFLRGRVDRRREEPSLKVSEVIALEEGPSRLAEAVILKVRAAGLDAVSLARVREICLAHRGDRNLFVRVVSPGPMTTVVRCGGDLAVRPDAGFISDIEGLLGSDAVEIVGRRRVAPRQTAILSPVVSDLPGEELVEAGA